ncbi:MAG: metal-sensitive transcriptional regulator [Actinomycetes bacterium]
MSEHIEIPTVPDDARVLAPSAPDAHSCHSADADADAAHQHGYITAKDNYLRRLRRIEGQARGLQRMVEEEKYCIDILTQVSAMTSALQSVALGLLEDHLGHCVVDAAAAGGPEADAKIKEASEAIARLVRS